MNTRLDVSISPVQSFVSQSRRTRDLWGSSYLLAFLSAHAMYGTVKAGGQLVIPAAEAVEQDVLYQWVCGCREEEPPRIGSLPNHFAVKVEGNGSAVAQAGIRSLRTAWERVCGAVWSTFVEPACPIGNGTEEIWKRQTDSFWEVMWTAGNRTAGNAEAVDGLLARRKYWRSHHPPEEPGDKCTVTHTLQELSGFMRARDGARQQDAFWHRIRGKIGLLDLRENERLCAVAFVKRMFPKVAQEALGWAVDASHWPSTVYVGAVPWMRRVMCAVPQRAAEYADAVKQNAGNEAFSARQPYFDSNVSAAGSFPRLDANYLHRESVMNEQRCPFREDADPGAPECLKKKLKGIYEAIDENSERRLGSPPAFYALLLADGDRLGKLVADLKGEFRVVSRALATFTRKASEVVGDHDGVAVYAGGDDVLAMLPIPKALACAEALSNEYRNAFADTDVKGKATLSAAVVFAHVRLPLNHVLGEAHRLLDDVAKDGNGRDSLAAAVLKPGGLYCEWATTWTRCGRESEAGAVGLIETLARQLEVDPDSATPGLSSALVYRIRDLLARVCGWKGWQPGSWGDVPEGLDLCAFLRAEISHSLETRMDEGVAARAENLAADVWNLLSPARNPQGGGAGTTAAGGESALVNQVGVDGLLLARFLADPEEQESGR